MNVLYVYADSPREWNCSEWNCIIPTKSINMAEGHSASAVYIQDFVTNTPEIQALCNKADIIVIERNYFGDTLTAIQYWKVRNKTIVAIFDDAYHMMHPKNISYPFWTHGELKYTDGEGKEQIAMMVPKPIEQFQWGLRMVKGIQVPSVNLARDWENHNNTYHVHNFLDMDKYLNIKPLYPHDGEMVIGWCGSLSHRPSFEDSGIIRALEHISKKHPKIRFLISGDKMIYDELDIKNKVFQPFVPRDQWTALLKTLDIGLAPLAGEYDKRRSWIKALEYMALKIPWVATNYITYDELKPYGMVTENGYTNWENALEEMIKNYGDYKKQAETNSFEFALSQSSYTKVKEVTLPLYEKLINEPYRV